MSYPPAKTALEIRPISAPLQWWVTPLGFAGTALLYALGAIWPVYAAWGFSIWSVFDVKAAIAVPLLSSLLLSPLGIRSISEKSIRLFTKTAAPLRSLGNAGGAVILSVTLLAIFFLFRSRALVYGDGFQMLSIVADSRVFDIAHQGYLQIGSLVFNRLLVRALTAVLSVDAQTAFSLLNAVGGVVAVWGLYAVVRELASGTYERAFLLMAALAGGASLLFFGHVENYTWQTALALWTVYLSLRYLREGQGLTPLIIMAVLTVLWHAITLPYLIVAGLAVWLRHQGSELLPFRLRHGRMMIAVSLLILVAMTALQLSGATRTLLHFVFVPVWPVEDNPYSAFSSAHVVDQVNLLIFLAPVGLMALLLSFMTNPRRVTTDRTELIFGWLALLTFWASFWVDPLIGAVRDWDLLSFVGFPLSLFGAYRLMRRADFALQRYALVFSAGTLLLLNLVPHIYEKSHADVALARVDKLVWEAPHYQTSYDMAYRALPWGTMLATSFEQHDSAKRYFYRRLSANDTSAATWFDLGQVYVATNRVDSAEICFDRAVRYEPLNPLYLMKFADILARLGRSQEALQYVTLSEQLNPSDTRLFMSKGIILSSLHRDDEALYYFRKAYDIAPERFDENFNLGTFYLTRKQFDSAAAYFTRAIAAKPSLPTPYERLILAELGRGREQDAESTFARLRTLRPSGPSLEQYRRMLER